MVNYNRSLAWNKFNGLLRYLMVHMLSGVIPYYVVNEYPKSGGSWLSQMLADAFGIPFPRNRLPVLKSSIMHGHYLHGWNIKNVIVIWRDCRDVVVSQYFHSLYYNDRGNRNRVNQTRKRLPFKDYENIRKNLPDFIRYVFEVKRRPRFTWSEFVQQWADRKDVVHVRYEDLLSDTPLQLKRLVLELNRQALPEKKARQIAFDYSFSQMSGRQPGQEDRRSFMRKGVSGDWVYSFSKKAREIMNIYAGMELIKLGYEQDDSWVHYD